jgi:hypothetical protein
VVARLFLFDLFHQPHNHLFILLLKHRSCPHDIRTPVTPVYCRGGGGCGGGVGTIVVARLFLFDLLHQPRDHLFILLLKHRARVEQEGVAEDAGDDGRGTQAQAAREVFERHRDG